MGECNHVFLFVDFREILLRLHSDLPLSLSCEEAR